MEYKYRAFISYRHISPDQEIAKRLHTLLETYRIPKNIRQGSSRREYKVTLFIKRLSSISGKQMVHEGD